MSTQHLAKIDKFYIVFVSVLIALAAMVILTFRGIFSAFNRGYEIDQSSLESDLKINKDKLNEAYTWAFEKNTVSLDLKF
jgi:hypothetical protein